MPCTLKRCPAQPPAGQARTALPAPPALLNYISTSRNKLGISFSLPRSRYYRMIQQVRLAGSCRDIIFFICVGYMLYCCVMDSCVIAMLFCFGMGFPLMFVRRFRPSGPAPVRNPARCSTVLACPPAPPHHLQAVLDMENMFDLLGQHPSIQDAPGAKPLAAPDAGVTLQGVNFQVRNRKWFCSPCNNTRLGRPTRGWPCRGSISR